MLPLRDRDLEQGATRAVRDDELQPVRFRRAQGKLAIRVQDPRQGGVKIRQIDPFTILGQDILVADVEEKARHVVLLSRIGVRESR
jgi:hypothetical protein